MDMLAYLYTQILAIANDVALSFVPSIIPLGQACYERCYKYARFSL